MLVPSLQACTQSPNYYCSATTATRSLLDFDISLTALKDEHLQLVLVDTALTKLEILLVYWYNTVILSSLSVSVLVVCASTIGALA